MLNPASPLSRLFDAPVRPGRVEWIGLRPARRATPRPVLLAGMGPEEGLAGDHYRNRQSRARQVTLIQAEHLAAIAAFLGRDRVAPEEMRRNVVTAGINLLALKGRRFRLGSAVLEMTGECHPCSRMEEVLGPGGYNAVRGHGGITARVLRAGEVALGGAILRLDGADDPGPGGTGASPPALGG
ncbi:MAG: MOSC domain-containing protein [Azospirillum brasilense]|nr:MAG: MOSC domain-containing protein [Azospirillum brasilense]